ncbi:hypothetical protein [Methylobacillus sp.]|uniref:hypothetical protein n=1 Tax=Methylobacillus sp. TaxID=56818 RepID=UPI002FE1C9ED
MNRIPRPIINDHAALQALAGNEGVESYPHLHGAVADILQGYTQYDAASGNAFNVSHVNVTLVIEKYLKAHYKSPPKDLKHIKAMRKDTGHRACPMCGSLHSGTLDHLLPQSSHGAFVVFSHNLVPACKCNSQRKTTLLGLNAGERILHPYFDDCLSERLVVASFEDLGLIPKVGLKLCVDDKHPDYAAIAFHFRNIVQQTTVTGYLRDKWIDLFRKPSLVVRELKHNPPTVDALREILVEELALLDDAHKGKNNWNSIFVAGLLETGVTNWLFQQFDMPGRLPDTPLS